MADNTSPSNDGQSAGPAVAEEPRTRHLRSYAKRDLTSGSIPKNVWALSWPQMVEGILNVVDQFADIFWAGRIGARSIAGLGVAQGYANTVMTGRMGFDTAMRAMVARAIGAGDDVLANHVTLQAFTLSSVFSLLMVIVGIFLTEPLMRILGVSDAVVEAGAGYMRILFAAQGAVAFRMMSGAALQASGDVVTPMKATMAVRAIHVTLSPCLIFGWLFFPELGLAGAALANALAQVVGVAMNFYALFTGKSRLHLRLQAYRLDFPLLWQIVKLGAPAAVTSAERNVAQIMLNGLAAQFGDYALAAFTLASRMEMLGLFGGFSVGTASGILVGQCLGAGKPERAKATVNWAVGFSSSIHIVFALILLAFPDRIASFFSPQPEFLELARVWLQIQSISFFFMGPNTVYMQTFMIAGDTLVAMLVTLVSLWGVQQPLAVILPNFWGLGAFGIAWAVNVAVVTRALVYGAYFIWGPWMKKNPLAARQS